ncbi:hypothetical protein [Streptomyces phaeoluteigriseus]
MADEKDVPSALPRGATGFFRPEDGPLPETDQRNFRTALFAAARAADGHVGEMEEQACPRTFHTASVIHDAGHSIVLCHAHHPWIAFARERRDWYTDEFLDPPQWSQPFAAVGFLLLTGEQLATPLSEVDTSKLSAAEWRQVRSYGTSTLGGVLFNSWD